MIRVKSISTPVGQSGRVGPGPANQGRMSYHVTVLHPSKVAEMGGRLPGWTPPGFVVAGHYVRR